MATQKENEDKNGKTPQKKFTIGFETEFFVIDAAGKPAAGGEVIYKKAAEAGAKENAITRECANNLIEAGSYPNVEGQNTMKSLLDGLKLLLYAAKESGYGIVPLGTYPGKFTPDMRKEARYKVQSKLFGKTRFQIAGRVAGYHCHYALPWGVFDAKTLTLKQLTDSKNQEHLVSAFNFLIAIDPVLTTFMQSSPFYQGRHFAKDTRMLVYRGGEDVGYPKGLYANLPTFGSLPAYVHAGADLISRIEDRNKLWLETLSNAGVRTKPEYRSILDTNWCPVKVNAHGTFEQRGMDMNRLPILFSVSVLIQTLMKRIQDGEYRVVPHDSGKNQPFSLDEKEKIIYIAPDTYVRKTLQKLSAYEGLANDEIYNYCRRLVLLVKQLEGEKIFQLLDPVTQMLAERKTQSDTILAQAKALGYKDRRKVLPQSIASQIALTHAKQMFEDIVILEKMIEVNAALSK